METSLPFRGHIKLFHLWLQEKNARANLKDEGLSDILGRRWNTFLSVLIELSDGWKIDIEGYWWPGSSYGDIRPVITFYITTAEGSGRTIRAENLEPSLSNYFEELLTAIKSEWLKNAKPDRRRGGPVPTPQTEKKRIVESWRKVQGTVSQEVFCGRVGISTSTLRRWERELEEEEL